MDLNQTENIDLPYGISLAKFGDSVGINVPTEAFWYFFLFSFLLRCTVEAEVQCWTYVVFYLKYGADWNLIDKS